MVRKAPSVVALLALACAPKPPEICRDAASVPEGSFFTRVTEDWGLSDVRGTHLTSADYDDDGLPDLLVLRGEAHTANDGDGQWVTLLHNTGSGFEDVTFTSGITADRDGGTTRAFQTAVWGDVDNDGDLDLFTGIWLDRNALDTYAGQVNEILLNQGDGTFALAPSSEVSFAAALSGASFVDHDRDGNLDLWLVGWYERYGRSAAEQDRLLRGQGDGTFVDVTADVGLSMKEGGSNADYLDGLARRPSFGATTCDVDDDGDADLLASVYARQWNQLWINESGTFADEAAARGYGGDPGLAFGDNQFFRCWCQVHGCTPDPGPASLSDCGTYAGYWSPGWDDQPFRLNGNTFTTACGDVDNDGDLDLYNAEIVHWHIGDSSDRSELLLNDGTGTFTRPGNDATGLSRPRSGSWNEGDILAAFLDVDNDGWKDVLLGASDYDGNEAHLWRQVTPGAFEDVAASAGVNHPRAVGATIADFDGDGDLDVVFASSTMRGGPWTEPEVHLYRNDLDAGAYSAIRLAGESANARGIGARVTVEAGGLTQTFEVSGGYGHMAQQHTTALHVGLGEACTIDRITVRWPDAERTETTWRQVRASYPITLQQGGRITYER